MTIDQRFGQQIHAFIEDSNGAIMCPHCNLEMACADRFHILYCGSGTLGDGHWIAYQEVCAGAS